MFAIAGLVLRRELRRRAAAFVGLAAVLALGIGVTAGALIAADRTDRAYPGYVRDAEVADLVINPSLPTRAIGTAIRQLPGVRNVRSDSLLTATVSQTGPATYRALRLNELDRSLQVRGSTDGRYESADRPVVTAGRFASGNHEVFVTEDSRADLEAALDRRLRVGDTIEMAFWSAALENVEIDPDEVVRPIAVETLRVAGFGRLPDEMLPDELYPRQRLLVSPDIARRYSCRGDLRPEMDLEAATNAVYPPDCARSYDYYAMEVPGGEPAKAAVRRAFARVANRLSEDIPERVRAEDVFYYYVSQDRADLDRAVDKVTRPTVAALTVFGIVAGLATLAVAGLAISRLLRRAIEEQRGLRAMGATRRERAVIGAAPLLVAALVGLTAAVPIAFVASAVGPAGSVRATMSSAGFALPGRVAAPVLAVFGIALAALILALAWSAAGRTGAVEPRRSRSRRGGGFVAWGRPATAQGIRAACSTRRSDGGGLVLAGCVIAVTVIVAAAVYGTNLTALVREPARYGWPWDVAAMTGAGYGDTDAEHVVEALRANDAVDDYGLFAFDGAALIAGRPVPTIYGFPGARGGAFRIVEGRAATRAGEAVLGATTADELDVRVGDRVRIGSEVPGLRSVRIVGTAVLPSLGAFIADRTGLGTGAFVPVDVDPAEPELQAPAAFTAIRLRKGVDRARFVAALQPALRGWDVRDAPPYLYSDAVRPPEIVNADSMQTAPLALGGVLAAGLLLGLALSIGVSVRDRRRELATLRALGFSPGDLRATVRWQAVTSVVVGLVIGIPLGIAAGRLAWDTFANQLGIVPSATIPIAWLPAIAVGVIGLGLVAAAAPARNASQVQSNELLDAP